MNLFYFTSRKARVWISHEGNRKSMKRKSNIGMANSSGTKPVMRDEKTLL